MSSGGWSCDARIAILQNMKETDQLDLVDRRIVRELQRDAGISHAALAEKVGASAASVWRRVRGLEERGVLGMSVRLADA
jgi:Lrp/AsnC family transcriptional regulator